LCRTFTRAVKAHLDGTVIPLELIRSYIALTVALEPLEPMLDLRTTWDSVAPSTEQALHEDDVGELEEWFELISLIWSVEPRLLRQLEFKSVYGPYWWTVSMLSRAH